MGICLPILLDKVHSLHLLLALSSSSNSNTSLGLDGADGDLNEDSIGITGLGCPESLPPSRVFAITASASSSLNSNITRSQGMSVCAAGNASALLFAATILPLNVVWNSHEHALKL